MLSSPILPGILQFSKWVIDGIEPFFVAFSSRAPASSISTPEIKNHDVKRDTL